MAGGSAGQQTTRKPYKITKQRERWSEQEHEKFLRALQKYGRRWKDIVDYVGTRSVAQVRSHAQKYFLKLEKSGEASGVPPARPKKRAAKPYPVQNAVVRGKPEKASAAATQKPTLLAELDPLGPRPTSSSPSSQLDPSSSSALASSLLPSDSMLRLSDALPAGDLLNVSDPLDTSDLLGCSDAGHPSGDKESNGSNAETSGVMSGSRQDHLTSSMSSADFRYASCLVDPDYQGANDGETEQQRQDFTSTAMEDASPTPDAGKLYAIVGSMFENGCTMDQQVSMMEQLPPGQRETLLAMMNQLTFNLKEAMTTQQMELEQFKEQGPSISPPFASQPSAPEGSGLCQDLDPWKLGSGDPLWQAVEAAQIPTSDANLQAPSGANNSVFPF
ncbi:hypothetical protein WJX72_008539 [[Myrmecia] bisecta]|uniref:Uncharacterized protein n=1 Tax=[Myrmecia] bisecta TaxID=41462 RepID=A0AAW1PKC8_9CHLO